MQTDVNTYLAYQRAMERKHLAALVQVKLLSIGFDLKTNLARPVQVD